MLTHLISTIDPAMLASAGVGLLDGGAEHIPTGTERLAEVATTIEQQRAEAREDAWTGLLIYGLLYILTAGAHG